MFGMKQYNSPLIHGALGQLAGKDFTPLSDATVGDMGRRIVIDVALVGIYEKMVKSSQDKLAIQHFSQLRATAGGITSQTSQDEPQMHMTTCGDFIVHYAILQQDMNLFNVDYLSGTYIVDIHPGRFAGGERPGLHKVEITGSGGWQINHEDEPASIKTEYAAINGSTDGLDDSATESMPPMIEGAYGQDILAKGVYTLFYNPRGKVFDENGKPWITSQWKRNSTKDTAQLLADEISKASNNKREIKWTIHESGSRLLGSALSKLPPGDYSNHTLMFMDPKGGLDEVVHYANQRNMKLNKGVFKHSSGVSGLFDWDKASNTIWNSKALGYEIEAAGEEHAERGAAIVLAGSRARNKVIGKGVAYAAGAAGTVGALTVASSAVTLSAVGLAALKLVGYGGPALAVTAKVFNTAINLGESLDKTRNVLASFTNDNVLNPELMPHKDAIEHHNQVMKKTGGTWNSYKATAAALAKTTTNAVKYHYNEAKKTFAERLNNKR